MNATQPIHRFCEGLLDVANDQWDVFVAMASLVIQEHTGEDQETLAIGMLAAKQRGEDMKTLQWRLLLWEFGAEADFYERLGRAVGKQPAVGSVAG